MLSSSKINYNTQNPNVESEAVKTVKILVDKAISSEDCVVVLDLPVDTECFTDLSACILETTFRVVRQDESKIASSDRVFLDWNGVDAFWSAATVRINGEVVCSVPHYAYTAHLTKLYGMSREMRNTILQHFNYGWQQQMYSPSVLNDPQVLKDDKTIYRRAGASKYGTQIKAVEGSEWQTARSVLFIPLFLTSQQLWPPNSQISIELRKAPSQAVLCCADSENPQRYKVQLKDVALYAKRHKLKPAVSSRALESLKSGGAVTYTALDTSVITVPQHSTTWKWYNALGLGAPAPARLYMAFVYSKSLYGSLDYMHTYFTLANIAEINVRYNSSNILVEPVKLSYTINAAGEPEEGANVKQGYLTMLQIMNNLSNPLKEPIRVNDVDYLSGGVVFGFELNQAAVGQGQPSSLVDIEVTTTSMHSHTSHAPPSSLFQFVFNTTGGGTLEETSVFLFSEYTAKVKA